MFLSDIDPTNLVGGCVAFSVVWELVCRTIGRARVAQQKKANAANDDGATPNPFMNLLPVNHYRMRWLWPAPLLLPLRLVGLILSLGFVSFVGFCVCKTGSTEKPLTGFRKWAMVRASQWGSRAILFCLGFNYIQVKGRRAGVAEAPIVVGNHRGPVEGMYLLAFHHCCLVSRAENRAPIIRWGMDGLQWIFVRRQGNAAGKQAVKDTIASRASERGKWPQVGLFPEGTTTNGKAVIKFKPGAFLPGQPVQPIAFEFPNSDVDIDPSFIYGVGLGTVMLRLMVSWDNPMIVHYLPVHEPTSEEVSNPLLFAENVRSRIAATLRVPMTNHAQEDVLLAATALKSRMNPADAVVEWGNVKSLFDMNLTQAKDYLMRFQGLDTDRDGTVTLEDIGRVLGLPADGKILTTVFTQMFPDVPIDGKVKFREFLTAMARMSGQMTLEEKAELSFQSFDADGDGVISEEEFGTMLRSGFECVREPEVATLFQQISEGDAAITKGRYTDFITSKDNEKFMILFDLLRQEQEKEGDNKETPLSSSTKSLSFSMSKRAFRDSLASSPSDLSPKAASSPPMS